MERPALPDFEKPPVTEVALSMQFEEITEFRSIHLGLLWQSLGTDRFPDFEEQLPVPAVVERVSPSQGTELPAFQLLEMPPMPRYLFVSADGTEVVQVQQDRFTVNWRKRDPEDEYPRFESLAALFEEQSAKFEAFLRDRELGQINVMQAEVTYVNRINQGSEPRKLEKIFSIFSGVFTDDFLKEPEEAYASFRFPMFRDERRIGRLYIDVRPEIIGDREGPLKMVLLARGKPEDSDRAAAIEFFSVARSYIVSGFASITSREAQKTWGRKDNAYISN